MDSTQDICYMHRALELARAGLGRVAPNPSVGCVIVKDGKIIAESRTQDGGRPHAEISALGIAGDRAKGATVYVTLEPCYKESGACCSNALKKFGIVRVVIGSIDENPAIKGRGIEALKNAGLEIVSGVLEEECRALNQGFFLSKTKNRPLVTLKIALSLDGKIATRTGHSQWITGEESRKRVHELRAGHDAILTGIGTVLADDPSLTARVSGLENSAKRIVLDTHLRTPRAAQIVNDNAGPVTIFTAKSAETLGKASVLTAPLSPKGGISLPFVLGYLAETGVTRLMVEAGQGVFTSFLTSGLWDHLYIMRAPVVVGTDGRDAFGSLGVERLDSALYPVLTARELLGPDVLEVYTPPFSANGT